MVEAKRPSRIGPRAETLRAYLAVAVVLTGLALIFGLWFGPGPTEFRESASAVVVGLVGIVMGYYFGRQGVDAAVRAAREVPQGVVLNSEPVGPAVSLLKTARERFDVQGVTLREFLVRAENHIVEAAKRGVQIRVLLMDPKGAQRFMADELGQDPGTVALAARQTARAILDLGTPNLTVKFSTAPVFASYFRADDGLIISPRFVGRKKRASAFLSLSTTSPAAQDYLNQFDHQWRVAQKAAPEAVQAVGLRTVPGVVTFLRSNEKTAAFADSLRDLEPGLHMEEKGLEAGAGWYDLQEVVSAGNTPLVVLVGGDERGPWARPETSTMLRRATRKGAPIAVVLLPGVSSSYDVPLFLAKAILIDARASVERAPADVIAWIRGLRAGATST